MAALMNERMLCPCRSVEAIAAAVGDAHVMLTERRSRCRSTALCSDLDRRDRHLHRQHAQQAAAEENHLTMASEPDTVTNWTFAEFLRWGRHGAGRTRPDWQCLFANDIDAKKGASYARNFSGDHLKVGNVANLTTANLPGHVDLAWASPPCQDVSHERKRETPRLCRGGSSSLTFTAVHQRVQREQPLLKGTPPMDEYESLSHTTWDCRYRSRFHSKCRRRTLYRATASSG